MRIKQIAGFHILADDLRRDIEVAYFPNILTAQRFVQDRFPNHVVARNGECIQVTNRDRSFTVVSFKPR